MLSAATRQLQALNKTQGVRPLLHRGSAQSYSCRWASSAVFNWEDPLAASELYTEEELAIQDTARQYCQERLLPRVLGTKTMLYELLLCF
jgi:glutaryl-CoA dehydrogenase